MAGGTNLNRQKFKELVLYLAQRSGEDEGFGMVKLNKLLYRADTEAFRKLGRSISGAEYEKQEYGPVARPLPLALDELAQDGYIIWHRIPAGEHLRKVPEAHEPPDLSQFTEPELEVIEDALGELLPHGGKSVSEWSHDRSVGWNAVEIGEQIPYGTALISPDPPSDEEIAYFRRLEGLAS
jgi:hypothetical protein